MQSKSLKQPNQIWNKSVQIPQIYQNHSRDLEENTSPDALPCFILNLQEEPTQQLLTMLTATMVALFGKQLKMNQPPPGTQVRASLVSMLLLLLSGYPVMADAFYCSLPPPSIRSATPIPQYPSHRPPPFTTAANTALSLSTSSSSSSSSSRANENNLETSSSQQSRISYRQGRPSDFGTIFSTLAKALMNPLGIEPQRFLIAETALDTNEKVTVGWGQIKPLGPAITSPNSYSSKPGSGSIEDNVDEDLWLEFESSSVEFPNGLASLPWTKEYKASAEAARQRRERRSKLVREERMKAGQLWELASVYVIPEYRGYGIGSDLVRKLMEQHERLGRSRSGVYALTLRKTVDWYRELGFEVVEKAEEIPAQMELEVGAGKIVTGLLGEELVCIRGCAVETGTKT